MIYGKLYMDAMRCPTKDEQKFVERAAQKFYSRAKASLQQNILLSILSVVLLIVHMMVYDIESWKDVAFLLILIGVLGFWTIGVYVRCEKVKSHVAKMCYGRFNIASGTVLSNSSGKYYSSIRGYIGTRIRTEIEFDVSREESSDFEFGVDFFCIVVDRKAYVVAKTEKGNISISDDVTIYDRRYIAVW